MDRIQFLKQIYTATRGAKLATCFSHSRLQKINTGSQITSQSSDVLEFLVFFSETIKKYLQELFWATDNLSPSHLKKPLTSALPTKTSHYLPGPSFTFRLPLRRNSLNGPSTTPWRPYKPQDLETIMLYGSFSRRPIPQNHILSGRRLR